MEILPSAANAVLFERQQFVRSELRSSATRLSTPRDVQTLREFGDVGGTFANRIPGTADNGNVIRSFFSGRIANLLA